MPRPRPAPPDLAVAGSPETRAGWAEVLTLVAHRLKEPLVATRQYVDLAQDPDAAPATRQEWLHRAGLRVDEALSVVDDWLTLARLQAGTLTVPGASADLAGVLDQVLLDVQEEALREGVQVSLGPVPAGLRVRGDGAALSTAIYHVVENGIRYGGPRVALEVHDGPEGVVLVVQDDGPGVAPGEGDRLFEVFFRGSAAASGQRPGSGLGLAISTRILQEVGGRLELVAGEPPGARFRFTLPRA